MKICITLTIHFVKTS